MDNHAPLIVGGKPIGDSVTFEMDGEARTCTIVMMPALSIEPIRVTIPFSHLKKTTANILTFEVGMEAARLARLGQAPPIGLQHKQYASEMLAKEAEAEIQAYVRAQNKAVEQQAKPGLGDIL